MHVIEVFFFWARDVVFYFFFNVAFGYKRRTVFFFFIWPHRKINTYNYILNYLIKCTITRKRISEGEVKSEE